MTKLNIVTGFLGAGKTTYIKHLLNALSSSGERIALLINDFGEVNIDADLYGGGVRELSDGCVCCTLKKDFATALRELSGFDRIIFEPSGVFMLGEMELSGVELCGVTCVVDGVNFYAQRADFFSFIDNQIRFADKVVVSKCDIAQGSQASQELLGEVVSDIATLYGAEVIAKPYSQFTSEDFLLNGNVKALERIKAHASPLCFSRRISREYSQFLIKQIAKNFRAGVYGNIIRAKGVLAGAATDYLLNVVASSVSVEEVEKNSLSHAISVMGETLKLPYLKRDFF